MKKWCMMIIAILLSISVVPVDARIVGVTRPSLETQDMESEEVEVSAVP